MSFDLDQVKAEIAMIVQRYPNEKGSANTIDDEPICVYFKDKDGVEVGGSSWDPIYDEKPTLVEPVCIVGRWVQDFHPELKDDPEFFMILAKNAIIGTSIEAANILGYEVREYLGSVQTQQDVGNKTWSELDI